MVQAGKDSETVATQTSGFILILALAAGGISIVVAFLATKEYYSPFDRRGASRQACGER